MASTIETTSLLVTITEAITLGAQNINSENQVLIEDINEFDKRVVTVPFSTEVTIISFATQVGPGQYILSDAKYIRITNKDDTNFVRLRVKGITEVFDVKLDAGKSFMMGNPRESANSTAAPFSAFVEVYNINAQADTAPVDVEFVVASS